MAYLEDPRPRLANPSDAEAIATLHAGSWRRHYRGAYSDAFLDGDVVSDRLAVWAERLREPDPLSYTIRPSTRPSAGHAWIEPLSRRQVGCEPAQRHRGD